MTTDIHQHPAKLCDKCGKWEMSWDLNYIKIDGIRKKFCDTCYKGIDKD
jgi:hypothetical protein